MSPSTKSSHRATPSVSSIADSSTVGGVNLTPTTTEDEAESALIFTSEDLVYTPSASTLSASGLTRSRRSTLTSVQSNGGLSDAYSVVSGSSSSTDSLTSIFKKLSVEEKEKALGAVGAVAAPAVALVPQVERQLAQLPTSSLPVLDDWQRLCRACGVDDGEVPGSITQCKNALKKKNVNLCDLSEALKNGTVAKSFPSLNQLRKYSKDQHKMVRKSEVKGDRLLKGMLRELFTGRQMKA
ncbi:hypothetical protein K402DRAFT_391804 [Aulographum hederae CBS 113979]|uniref:Uncharacterized protein n=1 Tax=Aulographum hederae CBS 113979 TaxID=1176131 RepID=A0A6G1H699_9PEZI|nr:hypothetical protein K402DRAFT_391804 [Aulographum hederae CBS 113979]